MILKTVPEAALKVAVSGQNLPAGDFGEVLGTSRTLLVFLRHLG
jgi:hypothetical protein